MESLKRNTPLIIISTIFLFYFVWANWKKPDNLIEFKKDLLKQQEITLNNAMCKADSSYAYSQGKIDSIAKFTTILSKSIQIIKAKTNAKIVKINSASHNDLLRDLDSIRAAR